MLLGATQESGIPAAVFASGDAQWLGTMFERPGELEGPRVRIASVPYAFKAQDAETLGGRPASDFVLTPIAKDHERRTAGAANGDTSSLATPNVVLPGTTNFLAKYVNSADLGSSAVYASGSGAVGIGTTAPADWLHVRFTNTGGTATGLAVQNLGNTAASYSGMLFYDQLGQLAQFQGFNNSTHEYRINNIAQVSPGGASNGSINFMIGSTSRLFVGTSGGVGIGTTSVGPGLEVSNSLTGALVATIAASTYGTNAFGGTFVARKARGTQAAPTAVQNGDQLALFRRRRPGNDALRSLRQRHGDQGRRELHRRGAGHRLELSYDQARHEYAVRRDDARSLWQSWPRHERSVRAAGSIQDRHKCRGRVDAVCQRCGCGVISRGPDCARHGCRAGGDTNRRFPGRAPYQRVRDHRVQRGCRRWCDCG